MSPNNSPKNFDFFLNSTNYKKVEDRINSDNK